jgi:TRAP-type mannitol/chloroaromatic compound transport system substrate-binding protein
MANGWMMAKYDAVNPPALRRLVASGAQLRPFPQPVLNACLNAALELYHEISATDPDFKKTYEAMTAFRAEQYLWWQVAEYTNDSFMIRNRSKV